MKVFNFKSINPEHPVIAWWSGGITSAVTCRVCIDIFGLQNIRIVFIDTKNEDEDTYRFFQDCEKWYGKKIETISMIPKKYKNIQAVWFKHKSLNVANGAICSSELKRTAREQFQKDNKFSFQAFGFDLKEPKRALGMSINYPDIKPIFPLLFAGYTKPDCINLVKDAGIEPPRVYRLGYSNNNCFRTGCVQGGIGYWQKMDREYPAKVDAMAQVEHDLTNLKGQPVTMLKDQSKNGGLVFLRHNPKYPHIKDLSMMKGREPKSLMECNGFCGVNDLVGRNDTADEINFQD